jgi:hypothetical protein
MATAPLSHGASPAEVALAIPLVAERVAHFVLLLQPTPEELARLECCNKGLRASLTPHWRELCVALSPGVVAKEVDDGRTLRYRRLY